MLRKNGITGWPVRRRSPLLKTAIFPDVRELLVGCYEEREARPKACLVVA